MILSNRNKTQKKQLKYTTPSFTAGFRTQYLDNKRNVNFPQQSQKTKSLINKRQLQVELNTDGSSDFEYNGLLLMIFFQSAEVSTTRLEALHTEQICVTIIFSL